MRSSVSRRLLEGPAGRLREVLVRETRGRLERGASEGGGVAGGISDKISSAKHDSVEFLSGSLGEFSLEPYLRGVLGGVTEGDRGESEPSKGCSTSFSPGRGKNSKDSLGCWVGKKLGKELGFREGGGCG